MHWYGSVLDGYSARSSFGEMHRCSNVCLWAYARRLVGFCKTLVTVGLVGWAVTSAGAAQPERSVVQIVVFRQEPDWTLPWRFDAVRPANGSGFVIKGRRLMTNAHVVSWARQILVRRFQDPRPYLARVEFAGHDCDLAVLTVEEERFFDGLEPLEFGELPQVRSTVVTYGYPAGGEEISYTRGVVSRIELSAYTHPGNRQALSVQTDAAINPGNSGGPVIQDDRVVGVAFQGIPGLENTGFFIPCPVIQHFLRDIADGRYDGTPQMGIQLAPLQNPAYRARLRLPDNDLGVRVDYIRPHSPATNLLQREDVILQIGDYPVGSDNKILFAGNRVSGKLAIQLVQCGEPVSLRVWRDGRELSVAVPVRWFDEDRAGGNQYDVRPRYYVFGGLVFTPLSRDYLRSAFQGAARGESRDGDAELTYELFFRPQEDPGSVRKEPIVLSNVLADSVNANWSLRSRALVDRVNGMRIECLEDVIRAFETNTNAFDLVEFGRSQMFECLDHAAAVQAQARILKNYNIPRDRQL